MKESRTRGSDRPNRDSRKGCVVWLTGLSGSGKSTLARGLKQELSDRGFEALVLDGDELRRGLSSDLGFSAADRTENVRRAAEVASLVAGSGQVAIVALISPLRQDRMAARRTAQALQREFIEVFIDAPLEVCEQRDPKHLYRRARSGELRDFTGISAPYECPDHPDIHVRSAEMDVPACLSLITNSLLPRLSL